MSGHTIPFTNIVIAVRKQHAVRMVDKEPSNIKAVDKELSNNGWWTRNCPIIGRWTRNRPIIGRWTRNRPMLVRWTRSSPILGRRTRNRAILGGWCKELSNIGWWTRNRPWRSITHSRALTHNAFAQRTLRSRSHAPAAPPYVLHNTSRWNALCFTKHALITPSIHMGALSHTHNSTHPSHEPTNSSPFSVTAVPHRVLLRSVPKGKYHRNLTRKSDVWAR
jgi:hypothetical protein